MRKEISIEIIKVKPHLLPESIRDSKRFYKLTISEDGEKGAYFFKSRKGALTKAMYALNEMDVADCLSVNI